MIKDSLKTVFKYPFMLLGFCITVVLIALCYLPMLLTFANSNFGTSTFPLTFLLSALLIFLVGAFIQFILFPVLFNYIYEVSQGDVEKGWFKRGLKRNWWKMFVTTIIALIPFYFFYFIFFIGTFILITLEIYSIGLYVIIGILAFIIILSWITFFSISFVSVAAEKDYGNGLKNIFKVGFKIFFKVMLVDFISIIIGFIIGFLYGIYSASYISVYYSGFMFDEPGFIIISIFAFLLAVAANAVTMSFLYVYANKLYSKKRKEIYNESQNTQTPQMSIKNHNP